MELKEIVIVIVVPVIISGILVPVIIRSILKRQKTWKHKIIKDNGKIDIIDEIQGREKQNKND